MRKALYENMNLYINNCKIADYLRKEELYYCDPEDEEDIISVDVGRKHGDKSLQNEVITKIKLVKEDTEATFDEELIDYFDMVVADAVYSLWKAEMEVVTPLDIFRVMSGDANRTLSAQRRDEIITSMDKLSSVYIDIYCEEEMISRGNNKVDIISRKFLPCEKWETSGLEEEPREGEKTRKSKTLIRYYLTDKMPLYEYAEYSSQIIAVPLSLISTDRAVKDESTIRKVKSDTNDVVLLKHILIRRIEVMRNEKNNTNERRISFIRRNSNGDKKFTGLLPLMGISRNYKGPREVVEVSELDEKRKSINANPMKRKTRVNGSTGVGHKKEYYSASAWTHKRKQVEKHVDDILKHFVYIRYIEGYNFDRDFNGEVRSVQINGKIANPFEL